MTAAYRPDAALESFLLPRGKTDRSLLDAALAEAKGARLDDQMVLEGGHGPERVPLLEHPEYPSCLRYANALCSDGALATYGAGEYQAPEYEAMRPMSDALYQLGVDEWRRAWPWLSPESQICPPDLCMVQRYDAWRGPRGAFMNMHTDMRPTHEGQRVASRGDVIGVSAGSSMNFWFGASTGAEVAKERRAVLLKDGDTWVWKHEDDLANKRTGLLKSPDSPPHPPTPHPPFACGGEPYCLGPTACVLHPTALGHAHERLDGSSCPTTVATPPPPDSPFYFPGTGCGSRAGSAARRGTGSAGRSCSERRFLPLYLVPSDRPCSLLP